MDKPTASQQPPQMPSRKGKPAPEHFRPSRVIARWWWLALIIIACIVDAAYKIPEWFDMRGPLYESSVLLEVKPIDGFDSAASMSSTHSSGSSTSTLASRPFIATQEAIIQAPATLELALQQKDLINRLGGSQTGALERMEKSLTVRQRHGTDLIEISYRDEDPLTAQDAVTEIYKSYAERRRELGMQVRASEMKALQVELKNQSDRVAEMRTRLMDIAEKAGFLWTEEKREKGSTGNLSLRGIAEKDLYEANRKKEQLSFEMQKLLSIKDDETMLLLYYESDKASPKFTEVYKLYEKTEEEVQTLRASGVGEKHPGLIGKEKSLALLKAQLLKFPMAKRELLKMELNAVEEKIEKLKGLLNDTSHQRPKIIPQFHTLRNEYKLEKSTLEKVQEKYNSVRTRATGDAIHYIVHEEPQRPTKPVTKGRDFFTTLFTLVSLPLAAIAAVIIIYLTEAIFPRRMKV